MPSKPAQPWTLFLALILGWLGFALDQPVSLLETPIRVSFIFGSLLPMIVTLAWGWRVGLLSATIGLAGMYPWLAWPNNGWVNLPTCLMTTMWFFVHGWAEEQRVAGKRSWYLNVYVVEVGFDILYAVYILTVFRWIFSFNPAPWAPEASTFMPLHVAALITIKSLLNGLLIILLADAALHLRPLRRLLRLPILPETQHDTQIIVLGLSIGSLLWIIDSVVMGLLLHENQWWHEIVHPDPHWLLSRLLLIILCLIGALLVARFVRRRVRLSLDLAMSQMQFHQLFVTMSQGVLFHDQSGRLVGANPAAHRLLHLQVGNLVPEGQWLNTKRRPLIDIEAPWNQVIRDGIMRTDILLGFQAKGENAVHWLLVTAKSWPPETPVGHAGSVCIWTEITQAKEATDALRQSEEDSRITLHSIGDAVIVTDATGRIERMNPVAEHLTGWCLGDARGKLVTEIFVIRSAISGKDAENPVLKVLESGEIKALANHTILHARDGRTTSIADSAAPIRRPDGTIAGVVCVFRDVTEHERLEGQLRQMEKLDALGQLAGGIAHDFNNMLAAIIGSAELAQMEPTNHKATQESIDLILRAANKATGLTRQLLDFARKSEPVFLAVDLHHEIGLVQNILTRTIDRRISIHCDLKATQVVVDGDAARLQNAILNLGINARDAMPDGGTLIFSTWDLEPDDPLREYLEAPLRSKPACAVSVEDNGQGIAPQMLEHLFEPFATTKPVGKGTGLGLASVYGTIRSHHGGIDVSSQPGKTIFTLILPLREAEVPDVTSTKILENPEPLRGLRILLADDEDGLRQVMTKTLENAGASVCQAINGTQALEFFQQNPKGFDFVILDQLMPGKTGAEVFHAIHAQRPEQKIILISGYLAQVSNSELLAQGLSAYLAKPFQRQELIKCLHRLLKKNEESVAKEK